MGDDNQKKEKEEKKEKKEGAAVGSAPAGGVSCATAAEVTKSVERAKRRACDFM